jgi:hypothetical protein
MIEVAIWFAVAAVVTYVAQQGCIWVYEVRMKSVAERTMHIARLAARGLVSSTQVAAALKRLKLNSSESTIDAYAGVTFEVVTDLEGKQWVKVCALSASDAAMIRRFLEKSKFPLDEIGHEGDRTLLYHMHQDN